MSDAVVVASKVGHRFGGELALVDVDVTLRRGRITGFLGRNGAGKSTTMRILAGVLVPSQGSVVVVVDGTSFPAHTTAARRQIGWAPEEPAVHPALTVLEQLRLSKRLRGGGVDVDDVVTALDLTLVAQKLCGTLSKGTRQRVGLAQALLLPTPVLLLDEPTAGLDPAQVVALRALLLQRRDDGAALLWSSHVVSEIEAVVDDVVVLHAGRAVHHGDRSTLPQALAAVSTGVATAGTTGAAA